MADYNRFTKKVIIPYFKRRIREVSGLEHIPRRGQLILAANHTVAFDHAAVSSLLAQFVDKRIYFPTKAKYFDFYSRFSAQEALSMIRVDPEAPGRCLSRIFEKIRRGHSVGIFPEGVGHSESSLFRGKTGVERLALWSGLPVIPVGITGGAYKNEATDWARLLFDQRKT